jgi:hypothetical protein
MATTTKERFGDIRDLLREALEEKRDERKRFLETNEEECHKIEAALGALGGQLDIRRKPPSQRGRGGRPRGSKNKASKRTASGNGRRGRPRGSGSQLIKLLRLGKTHPQSSNEDIAKHLGVQLSTATAFLSKTKKEGLITRENKRLIVTEDGQALLNETNDKQRAQRQRKEKASKAGAAKSSPSKTKTKTKSSKRGKGSSKKRSAKASVKTSTAKAEKTAPANGSGGSGGEAGKAPASEAGDNGGGSPAGGAGGSDEGSGKQSSNLLYDR